MRKWAVSKMFDFKKLGNDVRAYRQGSGLNCQDVAVMMGISTTTLRRIEKGERVHLQHIIRALKIINKQALNYYVEPK